MNVFIVIAMTTGLALYMAIATWLGATYAIAVSTSMGPLGMQRCLATIGTSLLVACAIGIIITSANACIPGVFSFVAIALTYFCTVSNSVRKASMDIRVKLKLSNVLPEVFTSLDRNGDGSISREDLDDVLAYTTGNRLDDEDLHILNRDIHDFGHSLDATNSVHEITQEDLVVSGPRIRELYKNWQF